MNVKEFIFTNTLVKPFDRISVGDAVAYDIHTYQAWVDIGVVTEIELVPGSPNDALITIAVADDIIKKRMISDIKRGTLKKIGNINNFKEDK